MYKTANPDALTVGEVWSSTPSILPYVQNDRLDLCFEFGLAGAIQDAVNNENPTSVRNQFETMQNGYPMLQYATFLTNHDMDRVFNNMGGSAEKMKLAASIYLTMPGIPFVYYGEEIGMVGTGDHLNIRRPMQWTDNANAGFSSVAPWQPIDANYLTYNVKDEDENANSILRHYKKLIRIRNEQEALRKGQTLLMESNSAKVFSYARIYQQKAVLVMNNTGVTAVSPSLSLPISAMPAGEYYITDLWSNQAIGKIVINAQGGFSNFQLAGQTLGSRGSWILLITKENPVTSVFEAESACTVHLTPNPAQNYVRIEHNENTHKNAQVRVFSADGRLVYQQLMSSNQLEIQTSTWHSGVYVVQLSNGKENIVKRLILMKS